LAGPKVDGDIFIAKLKEMEILDLEDAVDVTTAINNLNKDYGNWRILLNLSVYMKKERPEKEKLDYFIKKFEVNIKLFID
jgi:Ran GTPase-activating protein (RanGAP) involved in mRNA processing and transport